MFPVIARAVQFRPKQSMLWKLGLLTALVHGASVVGLNLHRNDGNFFKFV
jgi:hypothetical protein